MSDRFSRPNVIPETLEVARLTHEEDACLQGVWRLLRQRQTEFVIELIVGIVFGFSALGFALWRSTLPWLTSIVWSFGVGVVAFAVVWVLCLPMRECREGRLQRLSQQEVYASALLKLDMMLRAHTWADQYAGLIDKLVYLRKKELRLLVPPRSVIHKLRNDS